MPNKQKAETESNRKGRLKVLSFGAGALGTYIGGSLALQGHQVVFLERPEVAAALKEKGMHLQLDGKQKTIQNPVIVQTLEEAFQLDHFDLALFALKSFDTQSALEQMSPFLEQLPPVLDLQNGVENELALSAVLGEDHVIAGTVTSAIGRKGVGDIVLERLRGMGIAGDHPLASDLVVILNEAGLNARLYRHAEDMKWSKMLTNLLGNATSAILDMPPGKIFEHSGLAKLEINQLREALKVMDVLQIHPVDLPGTPVRALTFAVRTLPPKLSKTILKNAVGSGRGGKMPSFHIDLHNGRGQSEVDYLNGAVVRFGEESGVPTPVNRFLNDTLLALVRGELPLNTYQHKPEKLLKKAGIS